MVRDFHAESNQVVYWESWGDSELLQGWHDPEGLFFAGDFIDRGDTQALFINPSPGSGVDPEQDSSYHLSLDQEFHDVLEATGGGFEVMIRQGCAHGFQSFTHNNSVWLPVIGGLDHTLYTARCAQSCTFGVCSPRRFVREYEVKFRKGSVEYSCGKTPAVTDEHTVTQYPVPIDAITCSIDVDGDGFAADDCDDADATVHPAAIDICDGLDNNCNGTADEGLTLDDDGDGFTAVGSCQGTADDCHDGDPAVHPAMPETLADLIDNDCDSNIDEAGEISYELLVGLCGARIDAGLWQGDCVVPAVAAPAYFSGPCSCSGRVLVDAATGSYRCETLPPSCGGTSLRDDLGISADMATDSPSLATAYGELYDHCLYQQAGGLWTESCELPAVEDRKLFSHACACAGRLFQHRDSGLYVCDALPTTCGGVSAAQTLGSPLDTAAYDLVPDTPYAELAALCEQLADPLEPGPCELPAMPDPQVFNGDCRCPGNLLREIDSGLYVCDALPATCGGVSFSEVLGEPPDPADYENLGLYCPAGEEAVAGTCVAACASPGHDACLAASGPYCLHGLEPAESRCQCPVGSVPGENGEACVFASGQSNLEICAFGSRCITTELSLQLSALGPAASFQFADQAARELLLGVSFELAASGCQADHAADSAIYLREARFVALDGQGELDQIEHDFFLDLLLPRLLDLANGPTYETFGNLSAWRDCTQIHRF